MRLLTKAWTVGVALATAGALTACSGAGGTASSAGGSADQPVKLTVWSWDGTVELAVPGFE